MNQLCLFSCVQGQCLLFADHLLEILRSDDEDDEDDHEDDHDTGEEQLQLDHKTEGLRRCRVSNKNVWKSLLIIKI